MDGKQIDAMKAVVAHVLCAESRTECNPRCPYKGMMTCLEPNDKKLISDSVDILLNTINKYYEVLEESKNRGNA